MDDLKKNMMFVLFVSLFCLTSFANACEEPTANEIKAIFSNYPEWTEVESQQDNRIAQNNPIDLVINFANPKSSRARMGGKPLSRAGVTFCKGRQSNQIVLQKRYLGILARMTFTRHGNNLITSHDKANGTLFYRRSNKVNYQVSEIPAEEEQESDQTIVL